jgi:hypothetical protein
MTDKKEESTGAPCPPVEEETEDNVLANETDADYEAGETNAKDGGGTPEEKTA